MLSLPRSQYILNCFTVPNPPVRCLNVVSYVVVPNLHRIMLVVTCVVPCIVSHWSPKESMQHPGETRCSSPQRYLPANEMVVFRSTGRDVHMQTGQNVFTHLPYHGLRQGTHDPPNRHCQSQMIDTSTELALHMEGAHAWVTKKTHSMTHLNTFLNCCWAALCWHFACNFTLQSWPFQSPCLLQIYVEHSIHI